MSETRKLFESFQQNLKEGEERLNVFDIIDLDYVLTGLSNSKTAYLTGNLDEIIASLKRNGCEIKNVTNHDNFKYCDVLYKDFLLLLDSFTSEENKEITYILTGANFYYGGTIDYSKYAVSFTIEGNIKDEHYLKGEIYLPLLLNKAFRR